MSAATESQYEEFAGKSIRAATSLARRKGYFNPVFTQICGDLCVLRFKRHPHPTSAGR
ncbi:hypothetical protein IB275_13605 [Pseudomonas sp. PDM21]|uniref:hypothetical protein n=1 Tax=Pseudomonas sp. PDM21 TaxID=2769257 RepID=UPI00177D5740|nr:hypothetical protein [Pseudomonas sp. PDM21]MBD9671613.1 hypothetical protein [Pseudomonas sp. PDM21]